MPIRILEDHVINQIAAGEVVERPASVVRELLENALDAGAKRIRVTLSDGGRARVRIEDDGCGMTRQDAMMSLERHATSKIRHTDDLVTVGTLGFRGEAIPSIAAVSRFSLTTRVHDHDEGTSLQVVGGTLKTVEPTGCPAGTSVDVSALFHNLPARRKFLRRKETELHHCVEAIIREAMIHPGVAFEVRHEGRELLNAPEADDVGERARVLLGKKGEDLNELTFESGELHVRAYAAPFHRHRSTASGSVYLYVNGRFVRDPLLRRAVLDACRDRVPRGRYPMLIVDLTLPASDVDINVHPAKTEVRFHRPLDVSRAVATGMRTALSQATGRQKDHREPRPAGWRESAGLPFLREVPSGPSQDRSEPPPERESSPPPTFTVLPPAAETVTEDLPPDPSGEARTRYRDVAVLGQSAERYLVGLYHDDLIILDLRVAYRLLTHDQFRRQHRSGCVDGQRLLVPARVRLPANEVETLTDHQELLGELGVEVESLVGLLAVRGLPATLDRVEPAALLLELAHQIRVDPGADVLMEVMAGHGAARSDRNHDLYGLRTMLAALDDLPRTPKIEELMTVLTPATIEALFMQGSAE